MAAQVLLYLVSFFAFLLGVEGWRCAKYQHYFSQQPDYIDCVWDCCGNSFNRHCCAPIGIIVGVTIVGAVVLAALAVLLACWWQRRRARHSQGPRLFHNRRHSHYPVAPASVTRPAPMMGYQGPDQPGYKQPLGPGYRPPAAGYRSEKPPLDDEYRPDRPYTDRPYSDMPYSDQPYSDRPGPPRNRNGPPPGRDGPPPGRGRGGPPPGGRGGPPPGGRGGPPPGRNGPPPDRRPPPREEDDGSRFI